MDPDEANGTDAFDGEVSSGAGSTDDRELARALAAERAAAAHWRETSEIQAAHLREIRRQWTVRAALRLDRALAPLAARVQRIRVASAESWDRTALASAGVLARSDHRRRRRALRASITSVHVSPPTSDAQETTTIAAPNDDEAPGDTVEALDREIDRAPTALVCLLRATTEPLDEHWLNRLSEEVHGHAVLATAHLVHPRRRLVEGTPHDLCTRELGLDLCLHDGLPVAEARHAGAPVEATRAVVEVDASSATCLVLRRDAVRAIGGLRPTGDLDTTLVDLCIRLRRAGGRIVAVPDALVSDHRRVRRRGALKWPVDPAGQPWRSVVEQHGPSMVRRGAAGRTRFAITTAVPSRKLTDRWGDWEFARPLAASLRGLGHEVVVQTADEADSVAGRVCDVHLVLRGLAPVRATPGQFHVLWVISHPESLAVEECDAADLVLVASDRFAEALRARTRTPVEVLHQATDPSRFRPVPSDPAHVHPVTVVARSRERLRGGVAAALESGHRPAIYGSGWEGLVDPDLIVAEHVPNEELPTVYCSAGVVLNDHWETMRSWGFVSNRILDALACGAPIVSDHVDEIPAMFGDAVPTYRDSCELAALLREVLDEPEAARRRARAGREIVLAAHTFDHRASSLVELVEPYLAR